MKDTLRLECLLQALDEYSDAKKQHDKAFDNYMGYSWGYYGQSFVDKKEKAAEEFGKRLSDLIKEEINEILNKNNFKELL